MYTINEGSFESIALKLFQFQSKNNPLYRDFIAYLGIDPAQVKTINKIPFLPIAFFKNHQVKTGAWNEEAVFKSSGTTGSVPSVHLVDDLSFYHSHATRCFNQFFGSPSDYYIFALLPSYLERGGSSLVSMVARFIEESNSQIGGFYLNDFGQLRLDLTNAIRTGDRKIILWGVSYALLDFVEQGPMDLSTCLIIETGGMKGRRRELTREELHQKLNLGFGTATVHSEYGMTELLSQAYSFGSSNFRSPASMRVIGREIGDPFNLGIRERAAGLNIIDLANAHSCSFIETEDIGNVFEDGSFQVSGRLDNSDVRGCNLMVE